MAKNMQLEVINDNTALFLSEFEKAVMQGMMAIGSKAEGYAKKNCPVDTGRLRNSITWAVDGAQGAPNTSAKATAKPSDYAKHGEPGKNVIVIGTNVEYAPIQEFYNMSHKVGQAHFLRDAATTHGDEYKKIMEAALKD